MIAVPPGWEQLLTDAGQSLLRSAQEQINAGVGAEPIRSGLRSQGTDPDLIAALLTQLTLRQRAASKFPGLAKQLLFTPAGLEQASRSEASRLHAERFRAADLSCIADLGCGIGAESLAFLEAGLTPAPVEIDPFTAQVAQHNLTVGAEQFGGPAVAVRVADAERAELSRGVDGVFLDPARRTSGHRDTRRVSSPDDYSPSLTFALGCASRYPTGVKLGPGFPRELIPDNAEAQWVSVSGQLVEMGLWFGAVAREGVRRAALVIDAQGSHQMTAPGDADDPPLRPLGRFLYEPDGSVIRARLIGLLAQDLNADLVSPQIAYLTGDELRATPFATAFRVLEELPAREKDLKRELARRGIGRLEIKKRGADVDPAALRSRLRLRGPESATLFLTRVAGRHVALLAERVSSQTRTCVTGSVESAPNSRPDGSAPAACS